MKFDQPSFRVDLHQAHAGHRQRRVAQRHPVFRADGHHVLRTAAEPEAQARWPPRAQSLARAGTVAALTFEAQVVLGRDESNRRVSRRLRVPERSGDIPSAVGKNLRRFLERNVTRQQRPIGQRCDREERSERDGKCGHRRCRPQRARAARCRHHLRRRRLAGRERRGQRIAAGKRRGNAKRGSRTISGVAFQAPADRAVHGGSRSAHDLRGGDDTGLAQPQQFGDVPGLERASAGEHLVEHEAERIDVALGRDLAARDLLGRHVRRRARTQRLAGDAREAEVGDPHLAGVVEHDVRRLQIAMDDAAFVRRGQAGADLARDFDRSIGGKTAELPQQRRQLLAVHELHRQEGVTVNLVDVVDAADVGVRDLPRHAHFVVELHQAGRIAIELRRQELQRDRLPELQVVGPVDLAHPAASEPADDPIAPAEERAGREAPVIDFTAARKPAGRRRSRDAARRRGRTRSRSDRRSFPLKPRLVVSLRHQTPCVTYGCEASRAAAAPPRAR